MDCCLYLSNYFFRRGYPYYRSFSTEHVQPGCSDLNMPGRLGSRWVTGFQDHKITGYYFLLLLWTRPGVRWVRLLCLEVVSWNLFPGHGPGGRLVTPSRIYMTAKMKAGLNKKTRLHDLRHSFASNMLSSGATLYEVQKLLGHKDAAMTQRYAHLADTTLRERSESMSKIISPPQ